MFRNLPTGTRKLAMIAGAMFLVACAGTAEQAGYKQLTSAEVASVTQGMTREQVEQKLGPSPLQEKDRQGNPVLKYKYSGAGSAIQGTVWVTIDPASGKVVKVDTYAPHN